MTKLSFCKTTLAIIILAALSSLGLQAQTFTTLAEFNGNNGFAPVGKLVQGTDGNLYGFAGANGAGNSANGTIFKVTPSGVLTTIYSFGEPVEGALTLANDGNFYGPQSGSFVNGDYGSVFKLSPQGDLTTLYTFCTVPGCPDGEYPAGLTLASDGNFYGTTIGPPATIFKITPGGQLTTLYVFENTDGDNAPSSGVIEANDGNFYGTNLYGGLSCGSFGCGYIFEITPGGVFSTVYEFSAAPYAGFQPLAALVQASDSSFYGSTTSGGYRCTFDQLCGTLFQMTRDGKVSTAFFFDRLTTGYDPRTTMIQATDGNLYGTTLIGGANGGWGTIFNLTLGRSFTPLHTFDLTDGSAPNGLMQATSGMFYGTTAEGGISSCTRNGCGTIFSLNMGLEPFVSFVVRAGKVGQTGGILGQGFTGTTSVEINGVPANFKVVSDTYLTATVPPGATTGYVTVTTPKGVLTSNVPFRVIR